MFRRCVNHIGLDDQVVVQKLGWVSIVRMNAADLRSREVHLLDIISRKPCVYIWLVTEIQLIAAGNNSFDAIRL